MTLIGKLVSAYVKHGPARGKARVVRLLLPFAGKAPVRSRYGVLIAPHKGDLTNVWSISGGAYDDVYTALRVLEEGMCFIDIGANVGVFSMIASQRVGNSGSVIAFEPSPRIFQRLVANASANQASNFFGFQLALSSETGIARFQSGAESHTGTGHLNDRGDLAVLQARYEDIEPLLKPLIADRRIVLKIDVEGAECLVLRSLEALFRTGNVWAAVVEIDHQYLERFGTGAKEIYERMEGAGLKPTSGRSVRSDHFNEVFLRA